MKYAALIFAILAVVFGTMYFMKTKELNETVASLTNKANQLEVSVSEKDTQIETLNGQISTLTDEVTDRNDRIDTLNGTIAEQNAEISTLSMNSNLRKWQIEQLTSNLSEKSATIQALNESVAGYEQTLSAMGEYNREIEGLLIEASDLLIKINELNTAIESAKKTPSEGTDSADVTGTVENAAPAAGEEVPPAAEPAQANVTAESAETVETAETSAETVETAEMAETAETVEAAETAEAVETVEVSPLNQMFLDMMEQNPDLQNLVTASIAKAAEINPDPETNPVQSLEAFQAFVDASATHIPESLGETVDDRQRILYLNWLLDQPLQELEDRGLFRPSVRYLEPVQGWLTEYNNTWKAFLDSEASWNQELYEKLQEAAGWSQHKDWYEAPENWNSFNDFYSRHLAGPEARPVAEPEDNSVVTAPADALFCGVLQIGDDGSVRIPAEGEDEAAVTEATTKVEGILGEAGAEVAPLFHGGYLASMSLSGMDYHRIHSPVSGTVKAATLLPYSDAAGDAVVWDPEKKLYVRDSDTLYWMQSEIRGVVLIETEAGMVALIPVGLGQVADIEFADSIQPGTEIRKGDEIGFFRYGGSDILLMFEGKSGFTSAVTSENPHRLCGEEIGRFTVIGADDTSATPDEAKEQEVTAEADAKTETVAEDENVSTPVNAEEAAEATEPAENAEEAGETTEPAENAEETAETAEPAENVEETAETAEPAEKADEGTDTAEPAENAEEAVDTTEPVENGEETTVEETENK